MVVRKRPSERAPGDVSSTDRLWSLSLWRLFWGATRTACEPGEQVLLSRGGSFLPRSPVCPHTEPAGGLSLLFPRNVLTESARIARGKITDLAKLSAANHDAAVFPGGFGAAKNLYTCFGSGLSCFSPGLLDGDAVVMGAALGGSGPATTQLPHDREPRWEEAPGTWPSRCGARGLVTSEPVRVRVPCRHLLSCGPCSAEKCLSGWAVGRMVLTRGREIFFFAVWVVATVTGPQA